ncbi:LysR substrate-binding domain-containing protein [Photobacterium makurazakiensis]|uniref:LysR substrate-binding domain-containing protein n=1 Tax=Photobacterium makurazakiensis TaxID=2910234 RepID=UPI003D0AA357
MGRKQQVFTNMHTFSVAAKFLSFTKAAEELFISQGAVSQRIKQLEQELGFMLFVRLTRRLELTVEGERLLQALNQSFDLIYSEIDDIKFKELSGELYIGLAPTFAQSWLLKRLPEFQAMYPNLKIKLRVKASPLNFQHEPVDLAIYYSEGHHAEFFSQKLFDEYITPVCSPDYFENQFGAIHFKDHHLKGGQFENNQLLVDSFGALTLIHCSESLESNQPQYEWKYWLDGQKDEQVKKLVIPEASVLINHAEMAISAASYSMGMAMGRVALVEEKLQTNDLIAPFESVPSGRGYYLICPQGQQTRPRNKAFIDWLTTCLPTT